MVANPAELWTIIIRVTWHQPFLVGMDLDPHVQKN